jgi:hypothetical protein
MISVELSPEELALVRNALSAFLTDFGHNEHEVVRQLKDLLSKIPTQDSRRPH